MKKILIIGAGVLQLPAIVKAKELGLEVAVVDMSTVVPGIAFADHFYNVSTTDVDGVVDAAIDFQPDGVMTLATDMPMRSVAAVAERLNLHAITPDVAEKSTDKVKMIQCFQENSVPHPWFEVIQSESELNKVMTEKKPPFIMKPNDSSGSRGVVLVNDVEEVLNAYQYSKSISKSGMVLIEEYMQGPEVSVEILRIEGKTHVLAITDKVTTGAPYFVEMGHSQPSQLPKLIVDEIAKVAIEAVEAIGIDNSAAHVEIIVTNEGPKLVELGARMGGDCITTYLVPLSTGIDMVKACIQLALGELPDVQPTLSQGAAIRYVNCSKGVLQSIEGRTDILFDQDIKHVEFVKEVGEIVDTIHGSGDRIGYVISQSESAQSAITVCQNALEKLKIIVI